jgi:hypothetical protein
VEIERGVDAGERRGEWETSTRFDQLTKEKEKIALV